MSTTESALSVPSWLTTEFVLHALSSKMEHKLHDVTSVTEIGHNFSGVLLRVRCPVTGKLLIVKSLPDNETHVRFLLEGEYFLREIRMYERTLPLLRTRPRTPHCFYSVQDTTKTALVLEDLKPLGFEAPSRKSGLDLHHCRLVMVQLARLHGASAALKILDPQTFKREVTDPYREIFYTEDKRESNMKFMRDTMVTVAATIRTRSEPRFSEIADLIEGMKEEVFDELQAATEIHKGKLSVLNHGDLWLNNIMFKYDEAREPVECAFIDFQLARCGSPAQDLNFFFFTSTNRLMRRDHKSELLELYLAETRRVMEQCGVIKSKVKPFKSLESLRDELRHGAMLGFLRGACIVLPIAAGAAEDAPGLDSVLTGGEESRGNPYLCMYQGTEFCMRLNGVLLDLEEQSFFQVLRDKARLREQVAPALQ